MRILLDESLPVELRAELSGHETATVAAAGWSSMKNGELLRRAAGQFDVFVTAGRSEPSVPAESQQASNFGGSSRDPEQSYGYVLPLIPRLLSVIGTLEPRTLVRIGGE